MEPNLDHLLKIATELSITIKQVEATAVLLDEGATVPFISRYRKEATGSLDEVQIAAIRDRMEQLRELDKRRESILKSIREQEKLTPELEAQIMAAETMAVLEDIYLPYKPKRRTKATIAREKGLEPLAQRLFEQENFDVDGEAANYISEEKEVKDTAEALAGARDIMAEWMNENAEARASMRQLFEKKGVFKSRVMMGKEEEGQKFKDYFEWEEPIEKAPSHRILAMRRGETENVLMLSAQPEEEAALEKLEAMFVKGNNAASEQVRLAAKDCYKRMLKMSMETEVRLSSKKRADEEAIRVFADNLRQLLLSSPLGQKTVLALDPGFRTGVKTVVLDKQGKLLHNETIYPHTGQHKEQEAAQAVRYMVTRFKVEAIAIGNGTASRETEAFVKSLKLPASVMVVMVNESGASIYSASEVAREEFPDQDVTVRGAVSIGRRLLDPLAELVKIDPKSIGVGQYQHDVDQSALKHSLDDVVMSCVNAVGVEVNTASKQLLTYVSGLGPALAQNIVEYRNENGPFRTRTELKKVARLGEKAFEQAAGFLRIRDAKNPLDASAVHPESYPIVEQMAKDLGVTVLDLMQKDELRKQINLKKYVTETVGLPTLQDIVSELSKPGRDPRQTFEAFSFTEGVNEIKDLREGMKLPGIVTNITAFGAFVDLGVHQDGLVHVSHLSDRFVTNPHDVVKVGQKVEVTVLEVDANRKRISLSMKGDPAAPKPARDGNRDRSNSKNAGKKEEEPMDDFQAKLAKLKGMFK
ncbi:RNA-binding transcriptional accessory protein [Pontibacter sp. BT310]|uniref:RNA-binding transcriptional accessory protein n=1 Tax=Pontibacter populi TaxID=890055 RepID=A0ABS6XD60_9BACT|nr:MULTISPECIES: Tex family protein [Pontibacter]MBJ6119072.1 RNA-binding transcriptional accessory protein [Pontibacter sp. BT310]MBR0571500.1 RNA-binding transcriptional accessory protein [Microvirga sp. STS03]MBW3365926.1 RNA-binding transcriptional accessory protein [Pontibacter populi]